MKKLGFTGTLSLVIGNIIGVGIFTTTGFMTLYIDSPLLIMLAWILGALFALSGAQVYAVLAEKYPLSGGDYQYLSRALHPIFGYLFGWSAFFVTYSGSVAALGIAAAFYLNGIFNFPGFSETYSIFSIGNMEVFFSQSKIFAIVFIFIFTWINYRGILLGGKYQIILTGAIILLLILFSITGSLSPMANYSLLITESAGDTGISGFLTSLIAVLFAYIGWTTAVYVAEEIKDAKKNIPRALRMGVLIVAFLYIWINMVYLIAIPTSEMKDVINIATIAFDKLWGENSSIIISMIILVAVLSSLNSTILSGPRIYMAMGREGYFLGINKNLHPRFDSPHKAIVFQSIWSVLLVISGTFNQLLSFVIFIIVVFSFLAAVISLKIILKSKKTTIINLFGIVFYGLFCLVIMFNTFIEKPTESIIGILLVLIALPFYYFERKKSTQSI